VIGPKTRKPLLAGSLVFAPGLALTQEVDDSLVDLLYAQQMFLTAAVVVVIAMALFFANRRENRKQELIARLIDKGQEIPAVLLPGPSRQRELRRAVLLAGLGIGIGLVFYIASGDWRVAAWCLILLFLSAASFLNAALFYRDTGSGR
jgi:hypothetical protein